MSHPDVLVLGAGIVGLAIARELAGRGLRVEVVERDRAGRGATDAAAGMLAPLAEASAPGPFSTACREARDLWTSWGPALAAESGLDLDYDRSGALHVDPDGRGCLARLRAAAADLGEPCEEVDEAELRRRVPDLAPGSGPGLLLAGEHRVDNRAVARALLAALDRRGVAVDEGQEVLEVEAGRDGVVLRGAGWTRAAARLVVAAGAWSGTIPGLPSLPVRPVRGQVVLVAGVRWPFRGIVHGERRYAVRRREHGLLIGATVEEAGFDARCTPAGLGDLLDFARAVLPGLGDRPVIATWAGLRPGTADGLPLLGRSGELPLWIATGHYRNGILLAPWSAVHVADAVTSGADPPALAPFSPARFGQRVGS